MNLIRTSFKKYKKIFIFLFIIFLFGILSGILFYFKQDVGIRQIIVANLSNIFSNNVFDLKNIIYHLSIYAILFILMFLMLGVPLTLIVIFFEGIACGFIIPILFSIYKVKSIFCLISYFVFIKMIYIILLFWLFIGMLKFFNEYILYFRTKKTLFLNYLKKIIIIGIFIFINDLCIYFVFNKVLIFLLS